MGHGIREGGQTTTSEAPRTTSRSVLHMSCLHSIAVSSPNLLYVSQIFVNNSACFSSATTSAVCTVDLWAHTSEKMEKGWAKSTKKSKFVVF